MLYIYTTTNMVQCQATIHNGMQCQRQALPGSMFCTQHQPRHCQAMFQGMHCNHVALPGSMFCAIHQHLAPPPPPPPPPVAHGGGRWKHFKC